MDIEEVAAKTPDKDNYYKSRTKEEISNEEIVKKY